MSLESKPGHSFLSRVGKRGGDKVGCKYVPHWPQGRRKVVEEPTVVSKIGRGKYPSKKKKTWFYALYFTS